MDDSAAAGALAGPASRLGRPTLCLALFAFHFLLVALVCCRDAFWVIGRGFTFLPPGASATARAAEQLTAATLGQELGRTNLLRLTVDLYLHGAGIESGYGFFAPNVGGTPKLVFELYFSDGRVAYEPAWAENTETSLRLASFMDYVSRTESESLRDILFRSLARPIWQRHPDVVKIRAILGTLSYSPPATSGSAGAASYEFISASDVIRPEISSAPERP